MSLANLAFVHLLTLSTDVKAVSHNKQNFYALGDNFEFIIWKRFHEFPVFEPALWQFLRYTTYPETSTTALCSLDMSHKG